jgi:hypothetical protein
MEVHVADALITEDRFQANGEARRKVNGTRMAGQVFSGGFESLTGEGFLSMVCSRH